MQGTASKKHKCECARATETKGLGSLLQHNGLNKYLIRFLNVGEAARLSRCSPLCSQIVNDNTDWLGAVRKFLDQLPARCLDTPKCSPVEAPRDQEQARVFLSRVLSKVHNDIPEAMSKEAEHNEGLEDDSPDFCTICPVVPLVLDDNVECQVDWDALESLYGWPWQCRVLDWWRQVY